MVNKRLGMWILRSWLLWLTVVAAGMAALLAGCGERREVGRW
jgi:hypothetical protein